MKRENRIILIIISALSLMNVIFVPVFDVWGGLLPRHVDSNFFDVVDMIFNYKDSWSYWVVLITVSIFIPCIFMLVMSLLGKKKLYVVFNIAGIVLWIGLIIGFGIEDDGFDEIFDFDDGSISIGVWIAIILFVVSLFVALLGGEKANVNSYDRVDVRTNNSLYNGFLVVPNQQNNNQVTIVEPFPTATSKYCAQCGKELEKESLFCGFCGSRINR